MFEQKFLHVHVQRGPVKYQPAAFLDKKGYHSMSEFYRQKRKLEAKARAEARKTQPKKPRRAAPRNMPWV